MRKLALTLACITAPLAFAHAGSPGRFDGAWSVSVITDKGACDGYKWTIVVAGDQLKQVNELPVSASGAIDAQGQARFQVASVVVANGQMHGVSGSGKWDAPSRSCSGRWQAAKI